VCNGQLIEFPLIPELLVDEDSLFSMKPVIGLRAGTALPVARESLFVRQVSWT
jgi:hypothetical protein